jgi:hypothetical protein
LFAMYAPNRMQRPRAGIPAKNEDGWTAIGIRIVLDNAGTGQTIYDIKRQNIIFPHLAKGMVRNAVGARRNELLYSGECLTHSAATRPAALLYEYVFHVGSYSSFA